MHLLATQDLYAIAGAAVKHAAAETQMTDLEQHPIERTLAQSQLR